MAENGDQFEMSAENYGEQQAFEQQPDDGAGEGGPGAAGERINASKNTDDDRCVWASKMALFSVRIRHLGFLIKLRFTYCK